MRILIHVCRHYLVDTVDAVHAGELTEREVIERFMATLRAVAAAGKLNESFGLNLGAAIPAKADLAKIGLLAKLKAFYDHQIEKHGESH